MNLLYNLCAGTTGYIVDAVVAAIILIFVFVCAKRGFITCFFGFISTILALFIAVSFAKTAAEITGGLFGLQGLIETKCVDSFSSLAGFNVDVSGQNLEALLETQDLPAILVTLVLKNYTGDVPAGTTLAMIVGETAASLATTLIAGLALFILCKILLRILKKIFNSVSKKVALIGALNKLFGALVGLIEVFLIVSLLLSILAVIPSQGLIDFFNSSVILGYLYNHNPLFTLIGWFL